MLTVDDYGKIRVAHRDGMSIHEIARTFHHSRYKVRQILAKPRPRPTHAPSRHLPLFWAASTGNAAADGHGNSTAGVNRDSASVSQFGEFLSKLDQLKSQNPEEIKQIVFQIA